MNNIKDFKEKIDQLIYDCYNHVVLDDTIEVHLKWGFKKRLEALEEVRLLL